MARSRNGGANACFWGQSSRLLTTSPSQISTSYLSYKKEVRANALPEQDKRGCHNLGEHMQGWISSLRQEGLAASRHPWPEASPGAREQLQAARVTPPAPQNALVCLHGIMGVRGCDRHCPLPRGRDIQDERDTYRTFPPPLFLIGTDAIQALVSQS